MNESRLFLAWEFVVALAVTLTAIVIPAQIVFGPPLADFSFFEIAISIVYVLDVFMHFKHVQKTKHSLAPYRYSFAWLALDIVAALPFSFFPVAPWLRLLRLLKIGRLLQSLRRYWRKNIHQSLALRLAVFFFALGIATHWLSCGWLTLRGMTSESDAASHYISSMYFCITTLTTVGFGDIIPANNAQRLYTIGMMIFGVGVYGYAIGNVASLLTKIDPARAHHLEKLETLNAFMHYKQLPLDLRKRLTQYYTYVWEQRLGFDERSILGSLPPSLQTEVSLHLKREIIQKVPLFKDAGEDFIRDIALQITPVVYLPNDFVFHAGAAGNDMFFVSRGNLQVLSKDGQTALSNLSDGDFFGEIALILKQPRSASVRATTYCDLYRLDRELFERLLMEYPDVAAKIQSSAAERQTRN